MSITPRKLAGFGVADSTILTRFHERPYFIIGDQHSAFHVEIGEEHDECKMVEAVCFGIAQANLFFTPPIGGQATAFSHP